MHIFPLNMQINRRIFPIAKSVCAFFFNLRYAAKIFATLVIYLHGLFKCYEIITCKTLVDRALPQCGLHHSEGVLMKDCCPDFLWMWSERSDVHLWSDHTWLILMPGLIGLVLPHTCTEIELELWASTDSPQVCRSLMELSPKREKKKMLTWVAKHTLVAINVHGLLSRVKSE